MKKQLRIKRFLGRAGGLGVPEGTTSLLAGPLFSLCCLDGNSSFPDSAFQLYQLENTGYLRAFCIILSQFAVASKGSKKIHWLVLTA